MTFEELEADIREERRQEWLADQAKCDRCGVLLNEDTTFGADDDDTAFCSEKCLERYEQDRDEDRGLARHAALLGGESASERHAQVWRESSLERLK